MSSTRVTSKAGLKIAATSLLVSATSIWFVNTVLTIPVGWMLRPLFVAAAILTAGIAIGAALRIQGGDTDGR